MIHETGCPVCGGFYPLPATMATITCERGHLISFNDDIPSSAAVTPAHMAEVKRRIRELRP
jgi:hypothetical protein